MTGTRTLLLPKVFLLDTRSVDGTSSLRCIAPRRPGVQYFAEHHGSHVYVLTNTLADEFFDGVEGGGDGGAEHGHEYRLLRFRDGAEPRCGVYRPFV